MRARGLGRMAPLTLLMLGAMAACGGGTEEPADNTTAQAASAGAGQGAGNGNGQGNGSSVIVDQTTMTVAPQPGDLSEAEAASLAYMREEERLAHDVYAASARLWGTPIFANIAQSETKHTDAVLGLLVAHALPDPLAGLPEGRFATPAFQALHDELVARSAVSLVDALTVGAEIEELDMRDIVAQTMRVQQTDILTVYENLLKGSRNHLRSYVAQLAAQGVVYTPRILSQADFDAIVTTPRETGP